MRGLTLRQRFWLWLRVIEGYAPSRHLPLAVALALAVVWYRDVFLFWHVEWAGGNAGYYTHGPLVPLLSAVMIWMRWPRIAKAPMAPSWLGLLIVALAGILKMGSTWISTTGVEAFASFSFPILLWGMILAIYGPAPARNIAEPAAFLWLMCPLPGYLITEITFPLQMISTRMGATLAEMAGANIIQQGTSFHLADLSFFVGGTCSGFRSILALMTLAGFAAATSRLGGISRLALVMSVIPVGLAANAARIASITCAADRWGKTAALQVHDYSGLLVLALACAGILMTAKVLGWLYDTEIW